ncbi:hypothetical protein BDV36DRAFT_268825 [Aspergillus pseudocaelatus]|uniref:Uncharacterized protein n=1 Tax=Aspergillus pseudocaelatus TaxID=1825620 RepID=A0ABQ6W9P0_9EURO|nr:hypothetical protein BDV36DRAFT_268825 [Aspergillus pseudocaelatus]
MHSRLLVIPTNHSLEAQSITGGFLVFSWISGSLMAFINLPPKVLSNLCTNPGYKKSNQMKDNWNKQERKVPYT